MRIPTKRILAILLLLGLGAGVLVMLHFYPVRHIELRGAVSKKDIAEVKRCHRRNCYRVKLGTYPKWVPFWVQGEITESSNPIDIISKPSDNAVIVVYRAMGTYYYDDKGKHRGAIKSYVMLKGTNGWEGTPSSFP